MGKLEKLALEDFFLSGSFFDLQGKEPDSHYINYNEILCQLTDLQQKQRKTEKSDHVFESSSLVENLPASQIITNTCSFRHVTNENMRNQHNS